MNKTKSRASTTGYMQTISNNPDNGNDEEDAFYEPRINSPTLQRTASGFLLPATAEVWQKWAEDFKEHTSLLQRHGMPNFSGSQDPNAAVEQSGVAMPDNFMKDQRIRSRRVVFAVPASLATLAKNEGLRLVVNPNIFRGKNKDVKNAKLLEIRVIRLVNPLSRSLAIQWDGQKGKVHLGQSGKTASFFLPKNSSESYHAQDTNAIVLSRSLVIEEATERHFKNISCKEDITRGCEAFKAGHMKIPLFTDTGPSHIARLASLQHKDLNLSIDLRQCLVDSSHIIMDDKLYKYLVDRLMSDYVDQKAQTDFSNFGVTLYNPSNEKLDSVDYLSKFVRCPDLSRIEINRVDELVMEFEIVYAIATKDNVESPSAVPSYNTAATSSSSSSFSFSTV